MLTGKGLTFTIIAAVHDAMSAMERRRERVGGKESDEAAFSSETWAMAGGIGCGG